MFFWDGESIDAQVIFKEQEVALVDPVDLSRSVKVVKQPKRFSVGFSRRAGPGSIGPFHVAMGHVLGQFLQPFLHFTFQPPGAVLPNDKEVRCVNGTDAPVVVFALIRQFDAPWLIVKGQHIRIVLHFGDRSKLKPVTFKLNTHAHSLAGITTAHIASRTSDTASGRRCSTVSYELLRFFWKIKM